MNKTGGAAVVIDSHTGRVLAIHDVMKSVYSAFPPGSAFKPLTAIAAVESGAAKTSRTFDCGGKFSNGGMQYKCWLAGGHGRQDMPGALARSCNIYFYTLGMKMNGREISRWAKLFGFGARTGYTGGSGAGVEASGGLPKVFSSRDDTALYAAGDTSSLLVTPMQMAVFAAAIANGGTVFKPCDGGGKCEVARQVNAAAGIKAAVDGMSRCVTDSGGTCHALNNLGFSVAGKTGTARELGGMKTHAWFIGFSPVGEAGAAVAVFLDRGRGETDAAPVAAEIFKAYHKRVEY